MELISKLGRCRRSFPTIGTAISCWLIHDELGCGGRVERGGEVRREARFVGPCGQRFEVPGQARLISVQQNLRRRSHRRHGGQRQKPGHPSRIGVGWEETAARMAVKRAGAVLAHRSGEKPPGEVPTIGPTGDDEPSQGRERRAPLREDFLEGITSPDPALRAHNFTLQLRRQRADNLPDPLAIPADRVELGQRAPRIEERPIQRLCRHEQLGIKRQPGCLLLDLDKPDGGHGPDPPVRAAGIPVLPA